MSIISGITPKNTIWIKNLDDNGNLISKRVIKDNVQFDTGFRKFDGRPSFLLKTDMNTGLQLYKAIPDKRSLFTKLYYRTLMKMQMGNLENARKYIGQEYADTVLNLTGFLNKNVDKVADKLVKSLKNITR